MLSKGVLNRCEGQPNLFYETVTEVSEGVEKEAWVTLSNKKALTRELATGYAKMYWSCSWKDLAELHGFSQHVSILVKGQNGRFMCSCYAWGRHFYCWDSIALEHLLNINLIPDEVTDAHVLNKGTIELRQES